MLLFFRRTQKSPGTSFTMLRGRGEVDTDWSLLQNIHVWMQQNRQSVINWRKMCRHIAAIAAYQCSKSNKLFWKKKMAPKTGEKIRFLKPKYLRYGYKLRGKWNNSENNSWKRRGIFFFHSKTHENTLGKSEHFRCKNGQNRFKIAKSLRNSQAFVPGI